MPITTLTSPPPHMLITFQHYERLTDRRRSIVETLSMPGLSDIELDVPRFRGLPRPAVFE
jgi:hypothetical protein